MEIINSPVESSFATATFTSRIRDKLSEQEVCFDPEFRCLLEALKLENKLCNRFFNVLEILLFDCAVWAIVSGFRPSCHQLFLSRPEGR